MTNSSSAMRPRVAAWRSRYWLDRMILPLIGLALLLASTALAARPTVPVPAPAMDTAPAQPNAQPQIAVLAGGCFWGVQGVFQHTKGVTSAISGYAGGSAQTAQYETVSSGSTGHAESVQVTFDPNQISYGKILQIYFSVTLDPTQLNRQGPDTGTQYRSEIFATNPQQAKVAAAYIGQLEKAHVYGAPIVTKVSTLQGFYPAEEYHQDFMARHPRHPYIVINDLPKVRSLQQVFPGLYRAEPVLVTSR